MRTSICLAFSFILLCGCSARSPLTPADMHPISPAKTAAGSQTHLWGMYTVVIDPETAEVSCSVDRQAMFTVNVVNFMNKKTAALAFKLNKIITEPGYTDIDINVTMTHPFPGMPQYNGYDVRGVFMGDGSGVMVYNSDLKYPVLGTDQFMLADPEDGFGGPDGYTRWFNKPEFSLGGMPLFQYTQGKLASQNFDGSATLNPYRYYADGLGVNDDLWTWLNANSAKHGVFSSGASNTRNYYLRFPASKGIKYGYAIIANWEGVEEQYHPSNAPEAVALSVTDQSDLYYLSPSENGGSLKLDVSVWDWDSQVSGGAMEDYTLIVESTVLTFPVLFLDMTPVGGGEHYSTYHIEIPADKVMSNQGNECWLILEQKGYDYTNDFGVNNLAGTDPLAAFFRRDLTVGTQVPVWIKVTSPNGGESFAPNDSKYITWTSSGVTGTVFIEYSNDNFVSDVHTIAAGEANDGSYLWTVPCRPSKTLKVRVSSTVNPSINDKSDGFFTIEDSGWALKWGQPYYEEGRGVAFDGSGNVYLAGTHRPAPGDRNYGFVAKFDPCGKQQWYKAWGGTGHTQGYGLVVDQDGNSYVTGNFYGTTNFDPDNPGGPNQKTSVGGGSWDAWLVKFDTTGKFQWVRTWGGTYSDEGTSIAMDSQGNIYVAGDYSLTVDFKPGGGDPHTSLGSFDIFLCKYSPDGTFQWAKTWGGPDEDRGWGCGAGGNNVFVTGFFQGTSVNFNPDGTLLLSSNGGEDVFLSAFNTSGVFQWARNWGGTATGIQTDEGMEVAGDSAGNAYCTGYFRGANVDFNPGPGVDLHSSTGSGNDSFLSKFAADGSFVWAKTWGGSSNDAGEEVTLDVYGNIYITGWFWLSANFDPDGSEWRTGSFIDGYLSRFDSTGDFQWVHTWGGSSQDRGLGIGCDSSGSVFGTGFFSGTVNFAPSEPPCNEPPFNLTDAGNSDACVVKYFPDGCWH